MEGVREMTIGRKIWLCMMWLLAAMVVSTSAGAQPPQPPAGQVTVMTQNMNVGNFGTLREGMYTPEAVAKFFTDTRDNLKPKERAEAVAANDLKTPATEVVHDQLQLLRDALNNAPQARYDTVAIIPNSDIQFPSALGHVVRVTDRTVILAPASSNRLKLSNVQVQEFLAKPALSFPVTFATGETMSAFFLTGTFGWGSVDVEVGGQKFRFVTTHLMPVPPPVPPPPPEQALLFAIQNAGIRAYSKRG
jgi:hypothetical protein